MTPAQRRLKWVKKDFKPLAKPAKPIVDKDKEKDGKKPTAPVVKTDEPVPRVVTINDFEIDYSDAQNIYKKLKEI